MIPATTDPAGIYRVQVGTFSVFANAMDSYNRLIAAGFSPALERFNNLERVVIPGVKAADLTSVAQRLGNAGFDEIWLRREN